MRDSDKIKIMISSRNELIFANKKLTDIRDELKELVFTIILGMRM